MSAFVSGPAMVLFWLQGWPPRTYGSVALSLQKQRHRIIMLVNLV